MAKLILKRFHCAIDTNESGAESPYFFTYVGDLVTGESRFKMTRQGNWENEVDKGEIWTVNETVADGLGLTPSKTVALSAMVEEDEGLDVSAVERGMIKNLLDTKLQQFQQTGATLVNSAITGAMAQVFKNALSTALLTASGASDDLMGSPQVLALQGGPGELSKLAVFIAGGGQYRVRYAQA